MTQFKTFLETRDDKITELAMRFGDYLINEKKIGTIKAKSQIINWIKNFDNIQFKNFDLILELLTKVEFLKSDIIQRKFEMLSNKIVGENIFMAPLGEISESSYKLSALFHRRENYYSHITDLLDSITDPAQSTILLFDDFLNSGGQVITFFYSLLGIEIPENSINDEGEFRTKLNNEQIKKLKNCEIHLLYYKAFDKGIAEVNDKLIVDQGLKIKIHKHIVANFNNGAFGDYDEQRQISLGLPGEISTICAFHNEAFGKLSDLYNKLRSIGFSLVVRNRPDWTEEMHKNRSLGYGNLCQLTITDSNVPTITLTALWLSGEVKIDGLTVQWNSLLPRRNKLLSYDRTKKVTYEKDDKTLLHEFIVREYLKKNLVALNYFQDCILDYSEYFKTVMKIEPKSHRDDILSGNLFDNIIRITLDSNSENPLVINGFAGCGKTAFLSTLYLTLHKQYLRNEINELPIYINLHKYNKYVYTNPSEEFQLQAKEKLNYDLEKLDHIIQNSAAKLYVIVDGTDEYINPKVDLEEYLYQKLKSLKIVSKIIGVRQYKDHGIISFKKNKSIPFVDNPKIEITLQKINIKNSKVKVLIDSFAKVESNVHSQSAVEIAYFLREKIKTYKLVDLDIFKLNTLMKGINSSKYAECDSLSSHYLKYFEINNIDVNASSRIAFKLFNRPRQAQSIDKNNPLWWNIQRHESFIHFFVAFEIINRLKTTGSDEEPLDKFNFVYPSDINRFCKEIISIKPADERIYYKNITRIFNSLKITSKTHFSYLLGRLKNDSIKDQAKDFLIQQLEKMNSELSPNLLENSTLQFSKENKIKLLFHRTLYISLIYLDNKEYSKEYINQLINSNSLDNLNRGFHLEYYNDISFDPTSPESLTHEDKLGSMDKTFEVLSDKINVAIDEQVYYPIFDLELYTLASLVQHRFIDSKLDNDKKERAIQIIQKAKVIKTLKSSNRTLVDYLYFVERILSYDSEIKRGTFLEELYAIKELPRSGWLKEERNIPNGESVASHIYGALLLGYFYLPNYYEKDIKYDKNHILKLLFVHDIGEAYTGDILSNEKTEEDKIEEKNTYRFMSYLGTFSDISNVRELESLYIEFENLTTINGRIANDIDKLENLMQLLLYRQKFPDKIEDFDDFKTKLIDSIQTDLGDTIKELILNQFK